MTTEEKLKHFQDICMTDARERSARMLDDYMNALEAAFEEHAADARSGPTCRWRQRQRSWSVKSIKGCPSAAGFKEGASHRQESLRISCSWNCGTNWPTYGDTGLPAASGPPGKGCQGICRG